MRFIFFVYICYFITIQPIFSSYTNTSTQYKFDKLSIDQGLSQSTVNCILKDRKGFLWFGTNDGLNRFNGYSFSAFRYNPNDTSTISDSKIYCIIEDRDGDLWIGTRVGLNIYNWEKNSFDRFRKPEKLGEAFIRTLYEDKKGIIWIGTLGDGLFSYNKKTKIIKHYPCPFENNITSIIEKNETTLWLGTSAGGICEFDKENGEFSFKSFANDTEIPYNSNAFGKTLYIDKNENLWVCTEGDGLYLLKKNSEEFIHFEKNDLPKNGLSSNIIKGIHENPEGNFWIATDGGGINIFNINSYTFSYLTYDANNDNGLSSNAIYTIYKDDENILWIGTFGGGINILNPNNKKFKHFTEEGWNKNSLSHKSVLCFTEDKNRNIWIGTDGGGLNKFDSSTETFTSFHHNARNKKTLSSNVVTSLYEDSKGNLWVGTYSGGLNRFVKNNASFIHYINDTENDNLFGNRNVWDIAEDETGNIWIGTLGGLYKYSYQTNKITQIDYSIEDEEFVNRITTLTVDNENNIWVGGSLLRKYDTQTKTLKRIELFKNYDTKKVRYDIRCVFQDSKKRIWVGTEGLGMFLLSNDTVKLNITEDKGLPNNSVHEIQEDRNGNLWISTNRGLCKFNFEHGTIKKYDIYDGLQSNQFSYNASLRASDGRMYFGGINGFNVFNPDSIFDNPFIPPVLITNFLLFNKPVEIGAPGSPLSENVIGTRNITLPFKSVFTFEFTALNYTSTEKNQYRYKLIGFSDDWIENGYKRTATYTNLNPGDYTFIVKGTNNDGLENPDGATINITILPPWWKTKAAFSSYVLLIVLLFYGFRNYLINRQRMKNDLIIKEIEKKKIEEVNQMKLKFFTNISHEFRTPLSLILGPIDNLINSVTANDVVKRQLKIMKNNAERLLRLINQLMDFRKIESGNMSLNVANSDIIAFLRDIKSAFDEFAVKHSIQYRFISQHKSLYAWFDRDKMDKIFYNLLSNAFKFTPDKGKINFKVELLSEPNGFKKIKVIIEDNGIGISPERLPKIFERFYQIEKSEKLKMSIEREGTGVGLSLTKDLVLVHHGNINVESEAGKGCTFIVELPIEKEAYSEEELKEFSIEENKSSQRELYQFLDEDGVIESLKEVPEKDSTIEKQHLLIVEDNAEIREFIKLNLENHFVIIEADNGKIGYERAIEYIPDIIITDIMMPEMDGVEMTELVKNDERTSHIPIIILTARTANNMKVKGLESGADDYIPKPFNPHELLIKVRNITLSRKRLVEKFKKDLILQPSEVTVTSSDERFLVKCMQIVEDNISNSDFDVMHFVKEIGMSRSVLYRKIKAVTGQSVNELIRSLRLKRAAQLLASNEMTISEVTYEVGFNDPQYFSKCFSKQFGKTPSAYTSEIKNKKNEISP